MEQPAPTPNASTPIIEHVIAQLRHYASTPELASSVGAELMDLADDLRARSEVGRERYGTLLQAHNGRNARRDAYEEVLDLIMYARQDLEETTGADVAAATVVVNVAVQLALIIRRRLGTPRTAVVG